MKNSFFLPLFLLGCLLSSGAAAQTVTAMEDGRYCITQDDVTMTIDAQHGGVLRVSRKEDGRRIRFTFLCQRSAARGPAKS